MSSVLRLWRTQVNASVKRFHSRHKVVMRRGAVLMKSNRLIIVRIWARPSLLSGIIAKSTIFSRRRLFDRVGV